MFLIVTTTRQFYTGRAGDFWVSAEKSEAFAYDSAAEAERKAAGFNRMTALHGLTFEVVAH